jgi:hypothetical protein
VAATYVKPWHIRWHQRLIRPLQQFRRSTLDRLDPNRKDGERGTIS